MYSGILIPIQYPMERMSKAGGGDWEHGEEADLPWEIVWSIISDWDNLIKLNLGFPHYPGMRICEGYQVNLGNTKWRIFFEIPV